MVNGLSGERMLIGLVIGIAVLIVLVLKTKIQAFLALIISTVVVGVIGGMPLTNITIEVDGVEKTFGTVSYTHLDVYKRQANDNEFNSGIITLVCSWEVLWRSG